MADKSVRIEVIGLKPLQTALKQLEGEPTWVEGLKTAGKEVATIVSDEARRTAAGGATTHAGTHASMGATAVNTIRPLAGQLRATVAGGKASLAYFGGWEFGSHGGPRSRQFPGAKQGGYNIYPAISHKKSEVLEAYTRGLNALIDQYFP